MLSSLLLIFYLDPSNFTWQNCQCSYISHSSVLTIVFDLLVYHFSHMYKTQRLFYSPSYILHIFVLIIASNLIMHCFFCTYKTGKRFYLEEMYTLPKDLFICRTITCQDNIVSQISYSIEKNKTWLRNNIWISNLTLFYWHHDQYR